MIVGSQLVKVWGTNNEAVLDRLHNVNELKKLSDVVLMSCVDYEAK